MDLPEGSNMKAPGVIQSFPLEPFFTAFLEMANLKKAEFILWEEGLWEQRNYWFFSGPSRHYSLDLGLRYSGVIREP
jgi:hypothetical protein